MAAISVRNLSKTYPISFPRLKKFFRLPVQPEVQALKNISFEIAEGEIFGLIGRNGAGKTTLTKIIATLIQPTDGSVSVRNFDSVHDEVKVRSLIGLATAEERSFYWRLNAEQNLLFFARLYGLRDTEAQRRIDELFAELDLNELSKRPFSELSTGNKQRLAIARALLPAPQVLLLDEPTRSLDPLAAASLRKLIKSLKNVSILLTSHNLDEVEQLCERVAIISNGEIRVLDTPSNLQRQHQRTQQVKIIFDGIEESSFRNQLISQLAAAQIETDGKTFSVSFEREADDSDLGAAISLLTQAGARVLDVETKKASLLDVLESHQ